MRRKNWNTLGMDGKKLGWPTNTIDDPHAKKVIPSVDEGGGYGATQDQDGSDGHGALAAEKFVEWKGKGGTNESGEKKGRGTSCTEPPIIICRAEGGIVVCRNVLRTSRIGEVDSCGK